MAEAKRIPWKVGLGITLIFLFGAVTGVIGSALYVHHFMGRFHSRGPLAFEDVALRLLDLQLDLDEQQEQGIAAAIHELHLDLIRFKHEHRDEIDEMVDAGLLRIEAQLRPEQLDTWTSLRSRIRAIHQVPAPSDEK